MKNRILIGTTIMLFAIVNANAQKMDLLKLKDSLVEKTQKLVSVDSLKKSSAELKKSSAEIAKNFSKDSLRKQAKHLYYGDSTTEFHVGWEDGRVPEFSNAYTLHSHELRLNLLGRSSYAIGDRLEMSSILPLIISPNVSFKYRFFDQGDFASAIELGTARGMFPVGMAAGFFLPGAVVGGGTLGFVKGSDNYVKLYSSWHPAKKLTFSVRGSVSFLKIGYAGLVGVAGMGEGGVVAGVLPVNVNQRYKYLMGGFETDYTLNKKNALVLNSSISGFEGGKRQLVISSLGWTHANTHFHYTVGLYSIFNPSPSKNTETEKSQMPVGIYTNVYWIFNNRIRK